MGYRDDYRTVEGEAFWIFFKIVGFLVIIGIPTFFIGRGCQWFGEAADVAHEQFGPRGALNKYEWFRDKHEAIVGAKAKLRLAKADLKSFDAGAGDREKWTFEDKQERSRLVAVASAMQNIIAEMVAEYNANSKKFNFSAFRAADLPYNENEDD